MGHAVLGNAGGTRSTREAKGRKLALLAFSYSYTARPKLDTRGRYNNTRLAPLYIFIATPVVVVGDDNLNALPFH